MSHVSSAQLPRQEIVIGTVLLTTRMWASPVLPCALIVFKCAL